MKNTTVTIKPKDPEELGIIIMMLAESGVHYSVKMLDRLPAENQLNLPIKPKIKRIRPHAKVSKAMALDILTYMRHHPTEPCTVVAKQFNLSASPVQALRNGKHSLQTRGMI